MENLTEVEKACEEFHEDDLIRAARSAYGVNSPYIIAALYAFSNVIVEQKQLALSQEDAKGPTNEWLANVDKVLGHG